MDNERNYVAFISYRHKPLDIALAESLHKMLERYVVDEEHRTDPEQKHLGIVFRDRDELPLSNDLTEDIYTALDHSEYLIVICTNETPKSEWVKREIEYFVSRHGHDRVLTVLAQEPPELSFPEGVTTVRDAAGNVIDRIEPLAAYVVGRNKLHSLWKLRREFLRLVSAILGVPYGQLVQRQKRYRQKQLMAAMAVVLAVAGGFIGMLLNRNAQIRAQNEQITAQNEQILTQNQEITDKNTEIEAKNEEIQLQLEQSQWNESEALALLSAQQLTDGDRRSAILSALKALPSEGNSRPYYASAECSLSNALYAYTGEAVRFDLKLQQNSDIYALAIAQSGEHAVTVDPIGILRCFDLSTGDELWNCRTTIWGNANNDLAQRDLLLLQILDQTQEVLFCTGDFTWIFDLTTGQELRVITNNITDDVLLSKDQRILVQHNAYTDYEDGESVSVNHFDFYDVTTGECLNAISYSGQGDWSADRYVLCDDGSRAALSFISTDLELIEIFVIDTQTDEEIFYQSISFSTLDTLFGIDISGLITSPSMFARQFHMAFLPDGSLLTYFTVDTEHVYTNTALIHHYSANGELLSQTEKTFTFDGSVPDDDILAVCQNESYIYFVHPTHVTRIDKDRVESPWIYSLEHDYHVPVDDTELVGHYLHDDDLMLVFQNGMIVCVGYTPDDYPTPNFQISQAYGNGSGDEVIALVSAAEPNCVYFLRRICDTHPEILATYNPDPDSSISTLLGNIYPFPSGDRFMVLNLESAEDNFHYTITIYDSISMRLQDQFSFLAPSVLDMTGFSADETRILLDGYVYDLSTHTFFKMDKVEQVYAGSSLSAVTYCVPLPAQEQGKPVLTAYYRYDDTLYWWYDGKDMRGSPSPYQNPYGEFYMDPDCLEVGSSGLIVGRPSPVGENAYYGKYLFFSTQTEEWKYLDTDTPGSPAIAVGSRNQWAAFADHDNVLRIYDFDSGGYIRQFPMEIDCVSCTRMLFILDDTVLMLEQPNGRCIFIDAHTGSLLGQFTLENFQSNSNLYPQVDSSRSILYLCDSRARATGYRIDLSQWTITAKIPQIACYLTATDQIVCSDLSVDCPLLYPSYSTEQLIQWGYAVLGSVT